MRQSSSRDEYRRRKIRVQELEEAKAIGNFGNRKAIVVAGAFGSTGNSCREQRGGRRRKSACCPPSPPKGGLKALALFWKKNFDLKKNVGNCCC
ncbi:MAG: hypothetical protein V1874_04770 [Spirochaetota bacterium]